MAMEELRTSTTVQTPSGVVRTREVSQTKKSSRGGWLLGLIIIVVLGALALWLSDKRVAVVDDGSGEFAPGQTLTEAPAGQIITNFPQELILEQGVTPETSYSIAYEQGNVSQPVVTYRSNTNLAENIALYGNYLRANGWNITHEAAVTETPVTFFYATKDNTELNITFAPGSTGLMVTIAYVLHQ